MIERAPRALRATFLSIAALMALTLSAPDASAAASKEQVCQQVANKAKRTLWDDFRKAADEGVCRKPWMQRHPAEFIGCAGANKARKVANRLKDRWNRFFQRADAGWATWGPCAVSEGWDQHIPDGTLVLKRTWCP